MYCDECDARSDATTVSNVYMNSPYIERVQKGVITAL